MSSAPTYADAELILKLYEARREAEMRPRADGGEQVVQILRGTDVVRNQFIHLVEREITLLLS